MLAAVSGYRRGTNFGVSRTSTGYGDLQFFSWTHWSFHHCALGEEPAIAGDAPYAFIITAFPMTSYLLWRAHVNRSTHARLGSMGRVPAIPSPGAFLKTVFLAVEWNKRRVCLTDFFSGPVVAAVAAPVPLPFPTPPTPCETLRPLRHAAISSHPSQYTSTRRVIQRVLQSSSLKHHEGVVFRPSFHPCVSRWFRDVYRPARH